MKEDWRTILKEIDLTAAQIGKHCGVSDRTVEGWRLKNGRKPSGSAFKHLTNLWEWGCFQKKQSK